MNLVTILSQLEARDAESYDKFLFSRRQLLKTTALAAGTTGLLATTLNKAFAADSEVVDVLNFALLLEYLEAEFYATALSKGGLIPGSDQPVFAQIAQHEQQHVAFLKAALGGSAIPKPVFDFTGGGLFPGVFTEYGTFLVVAQSLEDLGVRAYKGQAPKLLGNREVLLSALKIHSVEARHAGEVRLIRGLRVWTSEQETGGAPAAVYAGENELRVWGPIDLPPLVSAKLLGRDEDRGTLTERVVRESLDEPLTREQVLAIAGRFVPSSPVRD